ncbi:DNA repair protein RecN [Stigmatella aurantiaca DW4/3-1]|uniref:DNA repair protein RecN n=1 Tax=Stigmatella aurantiaca (strain DW4/3-1) TaxID=378806 RepID=Q08SL3_STIAD|nr:DNA repair protein RecN [Stigmatella aurantiaca DW4/3-1]
MDALGLLLGGRADADVIRAGCDEASVEGVYACTPALASRLEDLGLPNLGDEVLVRRVVGRNGRGKAYVNGSLVTVGVLARLTRGLVDIAGQHEHVSLFDASLHRALLDRYGHLGEALATYGQHYAAFREVEARMESLGGDEGRVRERAEFLRFQRDEIDRLNPEPGEDVKLDVERRRLAGAEKLKRQAAEAEVLVAGDESSALETGGAGAGAHQRRGAIRHDARAHRPVAGRGPGGAGGGAAPVEPLCGRARIGSLPAGGGGGAAGRDQAAVPQARRLAGGRAQEARGTGVGVGHAGEPDGDSRGAGAGASGGRGACERECYRSVARPCRVRGRVLGAGARRARRAGPGKGGLRGSHHAGGSASAGRHGRGGVLLQRQPGGAPAGPGEGGLRGRGQPVAACPQASARGQRWVWLVCPGRSGFRGERCHRGCGGPDDQGGERTPPGALYHPLAPGGRLCGCPPAHPQGAQGGAHRLRGGAAGRGGRAHAGAGPHAVGRGGDARGAGGGRGPGSFGPPRHGGGPPSAERSRARGGEPGAAPAERLISDGRFTSLLRSEPSHSIRLCPKQQDRPLLRG